MRHDQRIPRSELPAFEWYETKRIDRLNIPCNAEYKPDYRWHLRARNGEIIAQGEGYTSKRAVLRAIATVRRNAALAGVRQG